MKRVLMIVLSASLAWNPVVFAQSGDQQDVRRYKKVYNPQTGKVKIEYMDPLSLPAEIANTTAFLMRIGGSIVTSSGKEKYKLLGWGLIVSGFALGLNVTAIDGRATVEVSYLNEDKKEELNVARLLSSIETDALFIKEGLGSIDTVNDLSAAVGTTPNELANLVIDSKSYADTLTSDQLVAPNRVQISTQDLKDHLGDLNDKQKRMVLNYLALRNIEVVSTAVLGE